MFIIVFVKRRHDIVEQVLYPPELLDLVREVLVQQDGVDNQLALSQLLILIEEDHLDVYLFHFAIHAVLQFDQLLVGALQQAMLLCAGLFHEAHHTLSKFSEKQSRSLS